MAGEIFMRVNEVAEELGVSVPYTVRRIFEMNKDNVLLEFTATCDMDAGNALRQLPRHDLEQGPAAHRSRRGGHRVVQAPRPPRLL